jgi:hypothetical protein
MEEIKLSKLIVKESDREFTKQIGNGEKITIRIPLPTNKATIITQVSRVLGGMDIKSFPREEYDYIKMLITLNNVIVDSPKWWEGADLCPDEDLLFELWNFYLESEIKFKEFLKKNNNKESGK